jgi:hypothetical protein
MNSKKMEKSDFWLAFCRHSVYINGVEMAEAGRLGPPKKFRFFV